MLLCCNLLLELGREHFHLGNTMQVTGGKGRAIDTKLRMPEHTDGACHAYRVVRCTTQFPSSGGSECILRHGKGETVMTHCALWFDGHRAKSGCRGLRPFPTAYPIMRSSWAAAT